MQITPLKTLFSITYLLISSSVFCQNLEERLQEISKTYDMIGGQVVVFCNNTIIENIAFGKADIQRNIATTTATKYRIASISKTLTAIAIMQLVEQNLLNLDSDISPILGFKITNPKAPSITITTRMLLSHTSTIIDGSSYSNFLIDTVNNDSIPHLSSILNPNGAYYSTDQFLKKTPGVYFHYSNLNYVILGTLVEQISGLRFDVYCQRYISKPLGIDASFNIADLNDINDLAVLYRKPNGVWTPQADNYQGLVPLQSNLNTSTVGHNAGRFGPQGGYRCSAQDLAKLWLVLMNKGTLNGIRLLTAKSCETMFSEQWRYTEENGHTYNGLFLSWGLGIHRLSYSPKADIALTNSAFMLGHPGEAYGLVSDAYFDPKRKLGFVFITNGTSKGFSESNRSKFYIIESEVFKAIEEYTTSNTCQVPTD